MSVISNFINSNQSLFADVKQNNNQQSTTFASDFAEATQDAQTSSTIAQKKKSTRDVEKEATEAQIKQFFDSIKNAGGAGAYVQKMNQEKIDKLVKEKEDELKEAYGLNSKPPLNKEDSAKATQAVEEGVANYKKELLKKLKEQSAQEHAASSTATQNIQTQNVQAQSAINENNTSGVKPKITSLAELLSAL